MSDETQDRAHIDYTARGLAGEAIQALRSHDALDTLRFENMERQHQEIKDLLEATNNKIDNGFKGYDQKFWTLAVTIITLLCSAVAMLVFKLLFPH